MPRNIVNCALRFVSGVQSNVLSTIMNIVNDVPTLAENAQRNAVKWWLNDYWMKLYERNF